MLNINELKELSAKRKFDWNNWLKKNRKRLEKMDQVVAAIHEEVSAGIDCLQCGNCCRSLGPRILSSDTDLLARALRIKPGEFVDKYLRKDEDGDLVFKTMPCPFLGPDNYCAVYENRPKACREYPHTDRKKFYQIYHLSVKNAETCPIVFEVLERIVKL